jgi:hypothetical protein
MKVQNSLGNLYHDQCGIACVNFAYLKIEITALTVLKDKRQLFMFIVEEELTRINYIWMF